MTDTKHRATSLRQQSYLLESSRRADKPYLTYVG